MYRTTCLAILLLGFLHLLPALAHAQQDRIDASMSADSFRRGLESVFRAASQSQSSSGFSSPFTDTQEAQSMSYDNQIKHTKTFFEKRQLNRMYRKAEKGPTYTQAHYAKWARNRAPERPSSTQLDSYGGRINWPVVLRGTPYKKDRQSLDTLYAQHTAAGGGMNTEQYAGIQQLSKSMQKQLRGDLKQITPEQYSYARKFLESLRYEARYPAGA